MRRLFLAAVSFLVVFAGSLEAAESTSPAGPTPDLASMPKLRSGLPAYPVPFMAIGRTPYSIPMLTDKAIDIQRDFGDLGGFSGLVDKAIGSIGYPGYRNFVNLEIAYDADKLCLVVSMPYPFGRTTRANANEAGAALMADDVFEILLDPRDDQGRSRGPIYRIVGNAAGVYMADRDLPQIGQPHQPWQAPIKYGSMMWDPMGSWMGAVQIPFSALGGSPADHAVWGVQMALRYADPKITAVLSPGDDFLDRARFAHLRFDAARRANYRCHWLDAGAIRKDTFCVGGIFSNGASEAVKFDGRVTLYKGNREVGHGSFSHAAQALSKYDGGLEPIRFPSHPATATERDTVARLVVVEHEPEVVVYDQYFPYWQEVPGERDWLKLHFAKEFTFNAGVYPSCGKIDYCIDCQTLREALPAASKAVVTVTQGSKELARREHILKKESRITAEIAAGTIQDGATYLVTAAIEDAAGKALSTKTETFTRHGMPFERAAKAGVDDIVPPPFTPPTIEGTAVSCIGRSYRHGQGGLLVGLTAAGEEILAAPATLKIKAGDHPAAAMLGDAPKLTAKGKGQATFSQTFRGDGAQIEVTGSFDYDGFYRFHARLGPTAGAADIQECCLEVPLRAAHATLVEAPVEWMWKDWEKCAGFLDTAQGRLWDSKRFPFAVRQRKGNMPPFCWLGDDDRGICFSCASDEGMHNDDARPAVAIDRQGQNVVLRAWFVNKRLRLEKPLSFEFALQASPFKPLPAGHRLWRCGVARGECCYGARGQYFHTGWGVGDYYPTYGRFLNLEVNAEKIRKLRQSGYDHVAVSASSCSECGGTPEYKQFWREWGSDLGWDKLALSPLPDWMEKHMKASGVPYDRYVAVESASNSAPTNVDYRAWWFKVVVDNCQTSMIYQDNPPYGYFYQPAIGYGYIRDDDVAEPTCATWNARDFMRRAFHVASTRPLGNPAPGVYPNVCGSPQPGRSFSFRGLTGEYLESDRLPLGMLRVWLSKQWGMNIDWLMQEPNAGAPLKYWRALCSRLFLLDVTSFSRDDSADQARGWLAALDVFWLDDPTIVWHPYYRNPTLHSTARPTTLVSTYTARGRVLLIVSNQAAGDTVESMRLKNLEQFGAAGLTHFYDLESGEQIEQTPQGGLRMFIPGNDFRVVLGLPGPWPFAAKEVLKLSQTPPQSTLDPRQTVTAVCQQLLASSRLTPVAEGHRLTEAWIGRTVSEAASDPRQFVYLDCAACADIDLGDKSIRLALLYDKKRQALLVAYFNPTDTDRLLKGNARDALGKKLGQRVGPYVLDPIRGISQWNVIDLPARSGRLELLYPDFDDYRGGRRGPFQLGTMWTVLRQAIAARAKEVQ